MKKKLMLLIIIILLFSVVFSINTVAWSIERQNPSRIPKDKIFSPFFSEQENNPAICIIQNDDGEPLWYFAKFDAEMGLDVYMDPAMCATHPAYPFKITDVHFYLYHNPIGWSWPVHIQVNVKNAIQGNKCLGPDTLTSIYSQSFTIPVDSSYYNLGRPMNLSLTPPNCVDQPFFLEIKYLDHLVTGDSLPSLLMGAEVTSKDTCNNWGRWIDGTYYEWSDFWEAPPPGDPIIRVTGEPNASCWYWKADRPNAPSGMPDFDQNQDAWQSYCGPTAVANCLWWFGAVPVGWTPPQLIDTLARYFHTNPLNGTGADTMQIGLNQYLNDYGFAFQESTFWMPDFAKMEDSLKASQDIILLLGFWWTNDSTVHWYREGGHFVTMAGVYSESSEVAFSDPDTDNAENGGPGRVRLPHASHPQDDTLHNNPAYASHDIYKSIINPEIHSPGSNKWEIEGYYTGSKMSEYYGINVPPQFLAFTRSVPQDDVVIWHTEVEAAVMICPIPSAVEGEEDNLTPHEFELYQNHPNPFNSETVIKFNLLKPSEITLVIYNILGQKVRTLLRGHYGAGERIMGWDGKDEKGHDLASGIYFYQLRAGDVTQTKRLVLLK